MDHDNAVDNDTDIGTAIRQVFDLDRWSGILDTHRTEDWAHTIWQRWAVAGHVPTDLDAGPDHAELIALLSGLALLHQLFTDEEDEFAHELTGAWPLVSERQLAHHCGWHGVEVETWLPDFPMDNQVAQHALPLTLHLMRRTSSREQVFIELLTLGLEGDDPVAEAEQMMRQMPSPELMHRYERFTNVWDLGERVSCPACANMVGHRTDALNSAASAT